MALKGKLETFNIGNLLQLLSLDQKTGVLKVSDGESRIEIFMKDGVIVYATSSQKEFRLGNFLKAEGVLSDEELQGCLQIAQEKGQQLGRVLVEQGYISADSLKNFLHYQAKEILYNLFLWKTGEFEYKDIPLNVEGKLIIPLNTTEIVMEASRRIDELSTITNQITSDKLVFKISERMRDTDEVKLNKKEWRILSLIDGTRTVRHVVNESDYDKFSVYKIIYSLMMSGFLEKIGEVHEKKRDFVDYVDAMTIFNDVFQVIQNILKTEIGTMAFTIFDECKAKLPPKQKRLLKGFDLRKDADINRQAILEAMNAFKDLRKGSISLLHSFNALLPAILEKEAEILGLQITRGTMKEIELILSYVKKYQKDSAEKIKIANEIEKIIAELNHRIEDKKEAKG
ncbi:MAG: DUF4388 domain-containing protein [Deltaproteobacteria bacterium]|nr:DUF4388 domain-containing protein [Deltaproteobacteria bacterium]